MTEQPMRAAWRLASALGCNIVPTTVEERRPVVEWAGLAFPGGARLSSATLARWRDAERAALSRGREDTAWALLPGSGRIAVIDADSEEWTTRWLERAPTPLVVRSPSPGRAHLYYRWPEGVDVGKRDRIAGPNTYEIKARGSTVHCPGSLHRTRKGRYTCSLPPEEIVEGLRDRLPELDLAAVEDDVRASGRVQVERADWDVDRWSTNGEGERRWAAYLRATPPASRGGRQSKLWAVACRAGDFGVPEPVARPGLLEWASTCIPPLPEAEVLDVLLRAYRTRRTAIGCDLGPEVDPDKVRW